MHSLISEKNKIIVLLLSFLILLVANFTIGIRTDNVILVLIINVFYFISDTTRRLIIALGIFILYWIIYDSMKAWPNWAFNEVDIVPLYNLEKSIFGISAGDILLTPNEYLMQHYSSFADVLCGLFYLGWIPLPLLFAFYMFSKNKNVFLRFSMAFFIVNIIGFIIYYLHPAAPPWYYELYGSTLDVQTKSNAAGLLRVDSFLGITLFEGLYSKGSNVFAAMPSLHASYPIIGLYYSFKQPEKWIRIIFFVFMAGIWFSAIYLNHHYILDVLAGLACGLAGIFLFEKLLLKNKLFNKFFRNYESIITASGK